MNQKPKRKDDVLVNDNIRAREVLLIGSKGEQLGVKSNRDALNLAMRENLDLVCVAPNAKPPVCRLMDYNKYRYEQQRKAREARKNQKVVSLKEIRLSPTIDTHDFDTKLRNARKFLEKGDKLKISIRFRGRMMAYTKQGREVISRFAVACSDIADTETITKMEGRNMFMTISPKKDK